VPGPTPAWQPLANGPCLHHPRIPQLGGSAGPYVLLSLTTVWLHHLLTRYGPTSLQDIGIASRGTHWGQLSLALHVIPLTHTSRTLRVRARCAAVGTFLEANISGETCVRPASQALHVLHVWWQQGEVRVPPCLPCGTVGLLLVVSSHAHAVLMHVVLQCRVEGSPWPTRAAL